MAEVKWIKIVTNIFDNRKIKQIETLPDGDTIIIIWFKLLCLTGQINDNGYVYLTQEVPYTEEMLSTEFNRPLKTIQLAMQTFQAFGMIEVIDDIYHISNWENYQNIEGLEKIREQTRKRVAKYREKQKLLPSNDTVTLRNATDIDKDIDKEVDKNNIVTVIKSYEEEIGMATSTTVTTLESYLEDLPEDMIIRAIELASERNKKNLAYIKGILNSWIRKNYKTLADVDNERQQKQVQTSTNIFAEIAREEGIFRSFAELLYE